MKGQDPFWTPYGENYITTVLLGFKRDCCLSMTLDKKSEELLLGGWIKSVFVLTLKKNPNVGHLTRHG